jgi:predicted ATPase/DNA-binding SARP family transcriptional activator
MTAVEFRVLGPVEVVGDDGHQAASLGGTKQRALLGALLLDAGRPVARARLIEAVWDDPPASAGHAVEVYVSKLRKSLAGSVGEDRIARRNDGYVAVVPPDELDLGRFRALAAQAAAFRAGGDLAGAGRMLSQALELWRGEPLACVDGAPIAQVARRELREEWLAAVEARVDVELALGCHAELVAELRRLVAAHPERELLWGKLMVALYRAGRQCEALETFRLARARLLEQLGLEPGRELRDLERRILEQDPDLDAPRERTALATPRPSSLPAPPSSFVGRPAELAAADGLLCEPDTRLVTVLGPGGVGKTRFAIELADAAAHRFDEVAWVGLEALHDPALVPTEIARALDADTGEHDRLAALERRLGERRVLLVLDNLEHVLDAAGDLHELLARCPGLHLLVTSREPLRLSSEQRYVLGPLHTADAQRLFVARARAVGAAVDPADPAVAVLCDRLDRLPLAIELAASHTDTQTPAQLLLVLGRVLDLDGRRDPAQRQRTLRATIDWSYRRLDDEQKRVFRALGVFAGGCTPEAARDVAGASSATLRALVDKNLLDETGGRHTMLDTIHEYVRDKLAHDMAEMRIRAAHAGWYAALVTRAAHLTGEAQVDAADAIDADVANLEAALWHLVRHDPDRALDLCEPLHPHGEQRHPAWYLRLVESVLASAPSVDSVGRGRALFASACLAAQTGDWSLARERSREALALARRIGDDEGYADALRWQGAVAMEEGNSGEAIAHLEEALTLSRLTGARARVRSALHLLGEARAVAGDLEGATAALTESLQLSEELGEEAWGTATRHSLADVCLDLGDPSAAWDSYADALGRAVRLGDQMTIRASVGGLAASAAGMGDHDTARSLAATMLALEEEFGGVVAPASRRRYEEALALHEGRPAAPLGVGDVVRLLGSRSHSTGTRCSKTAQRNAPAG